VEGSTPDLDERFAEWYVWAKREVGTDNRVCLGAAQAAIEAIEGGADDQAARLAARRSVAGHGIALVSRITPRRRGYAEWYDWARRESGGSREQLRAAARAALERLDAGAGADEAARAARETLAEASAVGAAGPAATAVWPVARQVAPDPAPAPRPVPSPAGPAASPPHLPVTAATASPWPAVPPPAAAGAAPARVPAPSGPSAGAFPLAPSHAYASPLNRLLAFAVDLVLLLIGMVVVLFALAVLLLFWLASSGQDPSAEVQIGLTIALNVILLALSWLYFAGLESSAWQATVGKRAARLVVTDLYGRRIGFGRATGRYFAKLFIVVGAWFTFFTPRRQALHDLMSETVVVRRQHLPLVAAPDPSLAYGRHGSPAGEAQGA